MKYNFLSMKIRADVLCGLWLVGLVERINMSNGKGGSFAGTPSYSSLALHRGSPPSPKDEIEALVSSLSFFSLCIHAAWAAGLCAAVIAMRWRPALDKCYLNGTYQGNQGSRRYQHYVC